MGGFTSRARDADMTVRNYIKKMRDRKEKARGDRAGRFCEFRVELNSTSLITVS